MSPNPTELLAYSPVFEQMVQPDTAITFRKNGDVIWPKSWSQERRQQEIEKSETAIAGEVTLEEYEYIQEMIFHMKASLQQDTFRPRSSRYRYHSAQTVERWIELYNTGLSALEISTTNDVSVNSVLHHLRKAGIIIRHAHRKKRRTTDRLGRTSYNLKAQGSLTWKQIGQRLWKKASKDMQSSIAATYASNYAKKKGLLWPLPNTRAAREYSEAEKSEWIEAYESGLSINQICQKAGVHHNVITKTLHDAGILIRFRVLSRQALLLGREAYRIRAEEGIQWSVIAARLWNVSITHTVIIRTCAIARRYAKSRDLVWPIPKRPK